jgi:anti-anti-sigma factor
MTRPRQAQYEPPAPADFERTVLGIRVARVDGLDDRDVARIELSANLVATNANAFRRIVTEQLALGARTVHVDLRRCPYVDSRGLGAVVGASNDAKRAGGRLVIERANDDLRALFSLTKLDQLFEVR